MMNSKNRFIPKLNADMRKGIYARTLFVQFLMDCGKSMLAAIKFSLLCFLKTTYYGTFTYITQNVISYALLNLIKSIFSDKPCIIAKI